MQDRSPPTRQIFLLRTAGPYIWVKSGHFAKSRRCPPGISPEVRKWGRYLIFDWIGLGKGNGRVQAYLEEWVKQG